MSARVIGGPYKPTRHRQPRLNPRWAGLRNHCVGAWLFWERGSSRLWNAAGRTAESTVTFGTGGEWRDLLNGPALHFETTGLVDLGFQRAGGVGLFAASTERWTAVVRCRVPLNTVGTILAKASATTLNRTLQITFNRPTAPTEIPRFLIRGLATAPGTSWGLDDGTFHTIWITWDGTTAKGYYDNALGAATLSVGTAAEEAENITVAARTASLPSNNCVSDIDFVAILDYALSPSEIIEWNQDLYAPWRPRHHAQGGTPYQYVRPSADVTDGGWLNEGGSNVDLYASIDEIVANDADWIQSGASPDADACEVQLASPGVSPAAGQVTIKVRAKRTESGNRFPAVSEPFAELQVDLVENTTVRATRYLRFATGEENQYAELTTAERAAIVDWTNLRLRFTATTVTGRLRVTQSELRLPPDTGVVVVATIFSDYFRRLMMAVAA